MTLSVAALNEAADAIQIDTIKLHSGDPGASGTANEIAGASGAIAFGQASNGTRTQSADVSINVPAGTVSHYSLWSGATLKDAGSLPAETYAQPGKANISGVTLTVRNPQ